MTMSSKVNGQQLIPFTTPGQYPQAIHSGLPLSNFNGNPQVFVANNLPPNSYTLPSEAISSQTQNFKQGQPNQFMSLIPNQTSQGQSSFISS